jgi:hypothetical protein
MAGGDQSGMLAKLRMMTFPMGILGDGPHYNPLWTL